MKDKYGKLLEDALAIVAEARGRLRAKGYESHDIGSCLIQEALIEMFGLEYGDDVLSSIARRCIGYSEELMGMAIVEQCRNSGVSAEAMAETERAFNRHQDNRVQRGAGVVEKAAKEVTERYGPFPTPKDLKGFPKFG